MTRHQPVGSDRSGWSDELAREPTRLASPAPSRPEPARYLCVRTRAVDMASESSVFGLSILGVIVGLAILLYGAEAGGTPVVAAGGLVVLAAVGLMTAYIAGMSEPEGTDSHGH